MGVKADRCIEVWQGPLASRCAALARTELKASSQPLEAKLGSAREPSPRRPAPAPLAAGSLGVGRAASTQAERLTWDELPGSGSSQPPAETLRSVAARVCA